VLATILAAAQQGGIEFVAPKLDYAALAPELVLTAVLVVVLMLDLFLDETQKYLIPSVAGFGVLAAFFPIVYLALEGDDIREMFSGAYVSDNFALVLKALFLASGYVVLLMSNRYIEEGDYYSSEYYFLLLSSLLGMLVMSSSRDLISIFVALELISIPAYLLAGWRKRDLRSNEAALKYYLLGVLSTGVMLYGMSLIFGATGTTILEDIREGLVGAQQLDAVVTLGIFFVIVGFAFKVSAVPFHFWAPDTYEGAPTPVTAFLSVASKAAGFVALLELVYVGFRGQPDVWGPVFWALAALSMTVGNLIALRQTNIVRMLAYSSIAQAGFMLVPLAVAGDARESALEAIVTYILIYTAMNLGAFAVVMAVARKTRSAELKDFGGLFEYAPGLTVVLTVFFFALAGIPPLGGWYAKFVMFRAVFDSLTPAAVVLGVIAAVNSVIALFYYASVAREAWMAPVPDDDRTPVRVPPSLVAAMGICVVATVAVGVLPGIAGRFGDLATFALGG